MSNQRNNKAFNWWVEEAVRNVYENFGVSVRPKAKSLLKFGNNSAVDTSLETIWSVGGDETYVSSNTIAYVSSSSSSDTGTYALEYHTVDGDGNFTFGVQTGTLAGQTKTAISIPCARTSRIYATDNNNWVGDIYVYEDDTVTGGVPDTASKIHIKGEAGRNQSYKLASTLSKDDFYFVCGGFLGVKEKTAAFVDAELEVRTKGSVFRPGVTLTASNSSGQFVQFRPFVIVPANADFRGRAEANTTGVDVTAWVNGVLARS